MVSILVHLGQDTPYHTCAHKFNTSFNNREYSYGCVTVVTPGDRKSIETVQFYLHQEMALHHFAALAKMMAKKLLNFKSC